jgi:RNA polymerase primary sigma factor
MGRKRNAQQDDESISLLAIDQYMRNLRWSPRLTQQEEIELFHIVELGRVEQMKAVPDCQMLALAKQARDTLAEGYQGLVVTIAKTFRRSCTSMELLDLVQEGNIGLLYAVERYRRDEERGFVPIASLCIRRSILEGLHDRDRMVRVPKHVRKEVVAMLHEKRQLEEYLGTEPTVQQIAQKMQISVEHIYELLEWAAWKVESLEHILEEDGEDREAECESPFASSSAQEAIQSSSTANSVRQTLDRVLSPRQREVIRLRYGLDEDGYARTQREVGSLLGIRQTGVSSVEGRAMVCLRREFSVPISDQCGDVA